MHGGTELGVAYPNGGERHTLVSVKEALTDAPLDLGEDAFIVVSGGARGVTASTVIALAQAVVMRF